MKQLNCKNVFFSLTILFFGIQFSACSSRSDADIQKDLTDSLQANAISGINAAVADGTVTLSGECTGDSCVTRAETIARKVDGVSGVENNATMKAESTDYTLRTQVQTIISKYNGVQADVADGVVVLRGSIDRSQIQPLMAELNNLTAKKIDNQLAIN